MRSACNVSNFYCIENRDEMIKTISYLLANVKQNFIKIVEINDIATISASGNNETEQLKMFKDLFDSGVLMQEEFDIKKK